MSFVAPSPSPPPLLSSSSSSSPLLSPPSAEASQWVCERCTWQNGCDDLSCGMCYLTRVSCKDVRVMWQWQAGDEWLPYDAATIAQVEGAYQEGVQRVDLCHGFFSHNAGYSLTFHPLLHRRPSAAAAPAPQHVQTNGETGMRRRVRRVAADEPSLFVDVGAEQAEADGRCSVCQGELSGEEQGGGEEGDGEGEGGGDSRRCVRLTKCSPGHSFHLACICSWILLRGQCPYCNTPL